MSEVRVELDRIAEVASRLELRQPNREAVESVIFALSQHYDVEARPAPFEAVVDSATGVGKTYVLAGLIEYLVGAGLSRNFAVIAPGRTILDKTVANFTEGDSRSLLGPMEVRPKVITAENFATPAVRAAMDDDTVVKLYAFSVQSLLRPTSNVGRRTRSYQEGLGAAFYEHLARLGDLAVFADEHHAYYGPAFSDAIRALRPYALVGLTATPHAKTPTDQIVYRYPLAAAIADRWVKTPVIVGRRDDRHDALTKITDGLTLLRAKARWSASWSAETGAAVVNPVMLVVAQTIADAEEYGAILRSEEVDGGAWAERVLVVTSKDPDAALAALATVEVPDSPIRVVISVGMLKEGWDVKNVYVIVSARASVSAILTEQTLGRGLRLPWGAYTGIEMLDTLEVLAHERYEELLRRANVLNEAFVDYRTRALLRANSAGEQVSVIETTPVGVPLIEPAHGAPALVPSGPSGSGGGDLVLLSLQDRVSQATAEGTGSTDHTYHPKEDMAVIELPCLRMTAVESPFSLADITDHEPFRRLGTQIATDPDAQLRRMKMSARVITDRTGIRRTELVPASASDAVASQATLLPLEHCKTALVDALLSSSVASPRRSEAMAAEPLIAAFVAGLGEDAAELLSAYAERAAARLVGLVTAEQRRVAAQPRYDEVVELVALQAPRRSARRVSLDRIGRFARTEAYDSWVKSLYEVNWFDSEPERAVANMAEDAKAVASWARLLRDDLPILWASDGRKYHADLVVVESAGTHWVVEVKADRDASSEDVTGKRRAARRWVNHVNASDQVPVPWRYLLATETDIRQAAGSWDALKGLGT
ncbi:MAG: DEAD/DEAH box helicase [Acidimicrobiales bacterium]